MKMQLSEIAQALGISDIPNKWHNINITSISFDSRNLKSGALFIPLEGKQDGHQYIQSAIDSGASATLFQSDHTLSSVSIPVLVVDNTLFALQKLAKYYLQKINPKIIAVTGSDGKTTTKDMIATVLSTDFNVTKTYNNFNNDIGVPITCLSMEPNTEILVIEMGMDGSHQLDKLSYLVEPDIAVITMIGEAHIEFLGNRDKIADAKMEITKGLKEDGYLIYNGDEPLLRSRTKDLLQDTFTFGLYNSDDLYATDITETSDHISFKVPALNNCTFNIPILGKYNVNNALAALSVGHLLHINNDVMKKNLHHFIPTSDRAEWIKGRKGELILDDVYNSNPTAVKAILRSFENVKTFGRRIIVLGDMLELGDYSNKMHISLSKSINYPDISEVYLYGNMMLALAKNLSLKMPISNIHYYSYDNQKELINDLNLDIRSDDIVLIKGSNGMHLENIIKALTN